MKKIHLIRHAKSSWKDPFLADRDRPLNKRGIRTAAFMGQHIYTAGCSFNNVFCSPAVRAQATIELISRSMEPVLNKKIKWKTSFELYTFTSLDLHEWVRSCKRSLPELLMIGHNPAFTDFCNELCSTDLKNIPTCGYAQLVLPEVSDWAKISDGCAQLSVFLKPKKLQLT